MVTKQLSLFLENIEGRLDAVLTSLKNGGINILSVSLADTAEYGLVRLIVDNPELGKKTLSESGFPAVSTDILLLKVGNKVGSLQKFLKVLSNENINIEYMYGMATEENSASIVVKTSNLEKAKKVLAENGICEISGEEK